MRSLHDPSRPRSAGGGPEWDNQYQVIPHWSVKPSKTPSMVDVWIFVARAYNDFKPLRKELPTADLGALLESYSADPEGTLLREFNYTPPPKGQTPSATLAEARAKTRTMTLEDLL